MPSQKTYLFTLMNYLAPMFPTMAILYDDSILGESSMPSCNTGNSSRS